MVICHQLTQIANTLERSFDFQRVVIKDQVKGFSCKTRSSFWYFMSAWLGLWVPAWFRKENRDTIEYFYAVFGKRRIEVVSKRCGLKIKEKYEKEHSLTRRDVRQLFLGLSEVYVEDVHDLFLKLKGERPLEGEIERAAAQAIQVEPGKDFKDLSINEWEELYNRLIPFETVRSIFLNNAPTFGFLSNFDSVDAMRHKRIFLSEKIRREGPAFDLNLWNAWVAKSMLKRNEQPVGVLIPSPRGFYQVYGRLEWGGASLVLLRSMHEGIASIVKIQGTRTNIFSSKDALLSAIDDFGAEIGTRGYRAIEEELLYLLGRRLRKPPHLAKKYSGLPPEGFCKKSLRPGMEKFECLAFSVGGAQIQNFIRVHPDVFAEAFLLCTPKISENKCRSYVNTKNGPHLTYGIEYDDRVHRAGRCNLGVWGDKKKVSLIVFSDAHMSREELKAILMHPPSVPESLFATCVEFLKAFLFAHGRHTSVKVDGPPSLDEYDVFTMCNDPDDAKLVQWILSNGDWEDVRIFLRRLGLHVREDLQARQRRLYARMRAMRKRVAAVVSSFFR